MDGIYEVAVRTPMGEIKGNVKLITCGNELSGYIETMGKRNNFSGGKVSGNSFTISGNINASITSIKYDIQGEVMGNTLNINAKTNMGSFKLQGKRIK